MLNDQGRPYDSYKVWDQLVELSGLPWIDQTELDIHTNETFCLPIINGNSLAWAHSERKCKLIAVQIERWLGAADDFAPSGFEQIWIADRWQANELAKTKPYCRFVPIGGHEGLGKPKSDPCWDLVPMCYLHGRREALLHKIAREGGWTIAPSALYPKRDEILAASRVGLSLHQWNSDPSINPLRAVLMACFKLPQVWEHVRDPFPYLAYDLSEVAEAIEDPRGYAKANYDLLTGPLNFRTVIEQALA
jgi:hypothetical protein